MHYSLYKAILTRCKFVYACYQIGGFNNKLFHCSHAYVDKVYPKKDELGSKIQ